MTNRHFLSAILLISFSCLVNAQTNAPSNPSETDNSKPRPQAGEERGHQGIEGRRGPGLSGTITEIKGDTITLKTQEGKMATVVTNASTRFMKDRNQAKLSDFKVGDAIAVRGEAASDGRWKAGFIGPQMDRSAFMARMKEDMGKKIIMGEVKEMDLDNLKLTILRADGVTQVIEVDENTSFKKQGGSITLADIKVGDRVMGDGQLKNGVFVPTTLRVGNFPQMQMPKQGAPN